MRRTEKETQYIRNLKNRNRNLEKQNDTYYREMIQRGEEITKMIRIFLVCEKLLPEGQRDEFRNIALEFAARNDSGRGSVYCKGIIDFSDARVAKDG